MFLAICVLCGLVFWPMSAEGALITIEIEAVVDSVEDRGNYLEGRIEAGDVITGSYVYESTTPDSSPLDPVQGNYWHYAPPAGIALTVGGFNFMTDPFNIAFHVAVRNHSLSGDDSYWLTSHNNLPLFNGTQVDDILWSLREPTGSVFSSDVLPIGPPNLDDWDSNILGFGADRLYGVTAHVISAVPEPATILLLALGTILSVRRK
jgi:hypothetical protein